MQRGVVVAVVTAALVFSAAVSFAQGEMGVMQGTITEDKTGAPLEAAVDQAARRRAGPGFHHQGGQERALLQARHSLWRLRDGRREGRLRADQGQAHGSRPGAEHRFDFKLGKAAPEGAKEFAEGFAAFNRGDNEAAVKFFEAAVQKAPQLPEVHVNLALAYLRVDRKADGVAALEKATTLAPDEPRTLFQLGGAYVEMTDYDKAIAAFEKGLAKQPDLTNTLAYEATVALGAVYFAKGDTDEVDRAVREGAGRQARAPRPHAGPRQGVPQQGRWRQGARTSSSRW